VRSWLQFEVFEILVRIMRGLEAGLPGQLKLSLTMYMLEVVEPVAKVGCKVVIAHV